MTLDLIFISRLRTVKKEQRKLTDQANTVADLAKVCGSSPCIQMCVLLIVTSLGCLTTVHIDVNIQLLTKENWACAHIQSEFNTSFDRQDFGTPQIGGKSVLSQYATCTNIMRKLEASSTHN